MRVCIAQVRFHFSPTLFAPISSQIPLFPEFLARFALTDETVSAFIPPICALLKQTKLEIFRNIIFTVVAVNLCIFIKPTIWSGQGVCVGIGKLNFGSQISNSCRYQAIGVEGGWERVTDFLLHVHLRKNTQNTRGVIHQLNCFDKFKLKTLFNSCWKTTYASECGWLKMNGELLLILVNELEVANMLMLSVMVKEVKVLGQFTTIAGRQHTLESLLALD